MLIACKTDLTSHTVPHAIDADVFLKFGAKMLLAPGYKSAIFERHRALSK
jgi:hypothetical protein